MVLEKEGVLFWKSYVYTAQYFVNKGRRLSRLKITSLSTSVISSRSDPLVDCAAFLRGRRFHTGNIKRVIHSSSYSQPGSTTSSDNTTHRAATTTQHTTMSTPKDIQQWHVTEPYVDLHCGLGEGPYYEKATQTLRFVDIKKKRIHTVSVTDGPASLTTLQLDERPTVTANVAGLDPQQKLLVGLKYGIALLDRPTGRYEYLARFTPAADNARLRSNDGAADPNGRFWLGTMTDFDLGDFQPEGKPPFPASLKPC